MKIQKLQELQADQDEELNNFMQDKEVKFQELNEKNQISVQEF
jgi:hypothetical protein